MYRSHVPNINYFKPRITGDISSIHVYMLKHAWEEWEYRQENLKITLFSNKIYSAVICSGNLICHLFTFIFYLHYLLRKFSCNLYLEKNISRFCIRMVITTDFNDCKQCDQVNKRIYLSLWLLNFLLSQKYLGLIKCS